MAFSGDPLLNIRISHGFFTVNEKTNWLYLDKIIFLAIIVKLCKNISQIFGVKTKAKNKY